MGYCAVQTDGGLYMVDFALVDRVVHNAYYYKSTLQNAKKVRTQEGWGLPETVHYEVDYARAKNEAKSGVMLFNAARSLSKGLAQMRQKRSIAATARDMEILRDCVTELEREGRLAKQTLAKRQHEASRQSMKNITTTAGRWETAAEVAKVVRDASADILLVTAGVMSGGTMLAVAAGGSLLKGAGKWQDTGNFGAGVVQAGFSFVTVIIPGGDKVGHLGKGAARSLVFVKGGMEFMGNTSVALVEGKSLGEATLSAGVDTVLSSGLNRIGGTVLPKSGLDALVKGGAANVPIPAGVFVKHAGGSIVMTGANAGKGKLNDAIVKQLMASAKTKGAGGGKALSDLVPLGDPVFTDLAILGPDASTAQRRWPTAA